MKKLDIIVTLDADGQHDPAEIPRMTKPIIEGEADIVIGSRFLCPTITAMPKYRKMGVSIINWLYNVGKKDGRVSDSQSGFRAYSSEVVDALQIEERGFGVSTEILIKARTKGFRIKEVPISCKCYKKIRWYSMLNPVRRGLGVALATIKWRIKCRGEQDALADRTLA